MKKISKTNGKKYYSIWIIILSILMFTVSLVLLIISIVFFTNYLVVNFSNHTQLDFDTIFSFLILLSTTFATLIASILYPINFSHRERHRREESDEWKKSGEEMKGLNEAIKSIDIKISKIKEANNSSNPDSWYGSLEIDSSKKKRDIFSSRLDSIIDEFHFELNEIKLEKNKFWNYVGKIFSSLKNSLVCKINDRKHKNLIEKNEWIFAGVNLTSFDKLILFKVNGEISQNYDRRNSKPISAYWINPGTKKVKAVIHRNEFSKDFFQKDIMILQLMIIQNLLWWNLNRKF